MILSYILLIALGIALFIYLIVAFLKPEWFP